MTTSKPRIRSPDWDCGNGNVGLVEDMKLQVCKKKQVQLENKTFRCACFLLKWKIFLPIKRYV